MVVTLVKESNGKSNSEIEAAILARLQDVRVPWMKQVDKITVLDA